MDTPLSTTPVAQATQKLTPFHMRITALTFGANFSDGFALGAIGLALVPLTSQMNLSDFWTGLIGASVLIGIFFGSITCGYLGDRFGRRLVYMLDFILIVVASIAQFWVQDPATLFVLRLLIGFGVGADYALGPTLVAEFVPNRHRGGLLASLTVAWTVGYTAAFFLGTWLVNAFPEDGWRWLLAAGAVPAALVLVLRLGTPESPRWLITQGRVEEARAICDKYLKGEIDVDALAAANKGLDRGRFSELFNKSNLRNTIFGVLFYNLQVIPYFAIYTFLPDILDKLGLADDFFSGVLLNIFLLLGGIVGLVVITRVGRRPLTIWTFGIMAVALSVVAFATNAPFWLVLGAFLIFTFVMSGAANLDQVYPPELFPTRVRAAGVGFLNGTSRIGSAVGTFLLPVAMTSFGVTGAMIGMVAILLAGMVVSIFMAPETAGMELDPADYGH